MNHSSPSPKVSVIIPVYNVEKYIERCARSLFSQTLDEMEFIFVDDCSPDKSIEIVMAVLEEYPNRKLQVRIIRNEVNIGQSLSRKHAIAEAKGKYITFVDSDDWVNEEMYEIMWNNSNEGYVDFIECDFVIESINKSIPVSIVPSNLIKNILSGNFGGSLWNKLFKSDLFCPDLDWPSTNMGEDAAIVVQTFLRSKNYQHVNRPLYHYRFNLNSTVNARSQQSCLNRFNGLIESLEIIINCLKKHNLEQDYSKEIFIRKILTQLMLSPVINNDKVWTLFKLSYPEITILKVLTSKSPLILKIRYLLLCSRLYPKIYKIYKKLECLHP